MKMSAEADEKEAKARVMSAAEKKAQELKDAEIQKKEEKLQKMLVKAAIRRQKENEKFEIKLVRRFPFAR
jgi:hypothetical protein